MNKEHTELLWKNYPRTYCGRTKSITQSLIPFGFECGDGWFYPIKKLSAKIEALNIMLEPYHVKIEATQVKEKYAQLSWYYMVLPTDTDVEYPDESEQTPEMKEKLQKQEVMLEYANEMAEEYIDKAENECMEVCEDCGTQFYEGNPRVMTTGWMNILCKKCAEKEKRSYVLYPNLNKDPFHKEEKTSEPNKGEKKQ